MRTAVVATSYPGTPDDPSGHFVRAEALAAAARGDEVHVLSAAPFSGDPGVVAHRLGGEALFAWPGAVDRFRERPTRIASAGSFAAHAVAEFRKIRADRVVAHWMVPSALLAAFGRHELEVVCHGADVRLLASLPRAIGSTIVRTIAERATTIRFVASRLEQELVASIGPEAERALARVSIVAPPLVDVSDARNAPKTAVPYIVASGRLLVSKRLDVAIDAARIADVPLVVLGDGPAEPRLRASAGEHVRFFGRIGRRRALGVVRGALALVHPSEVDAAPTAVLEARRLGVPVLASDVGDVSAWSEEDRGIVVLPRDARAYAEALWALTPGPPPAAGEGS